MGSVEGQRKEDGRRAGVKDKKEEEERERRGREETERVITYSYSFGIILLAKSFLSFIA